MSASSLFKLAAVGLIVGAALVTLGDVLTPQGDPKQMVASPLLYPTLIAGVVGSIMIVAAWPAAYLRQRAESGVPGFAGMLTVFAGATAITVGGKLVQLLVFPWLVSVLSNSQMENGLPALSLFFPISSAVVSLGGVVFAVAMFRAKVFSRPLSVAFGVLAVLSFVLGAPNLPFGIPEIAYMVALAWTGVELYRLSASTVPVSRPVAAPGTA